MIEVDGSQGEGGGQVLRSALSLSVITNKAIHVKNIRANRSSPGLKSQHLKAVDAAAAISKADVQGSFLNSDSILFSPRELRTGRYKVDIPTAGSTSLVLQTIFVPLSFAKSATSMIISGGTHVPWSPSYDYLSLHWMEFLKNSGFDAQLKLELAGYYPQGKGRITAIIRPTSHINPLRLTKRGNLKRINGISSVSNLNIQIADRQKRRAILHLQKISPEINIKTINMPSKFKGTSLLIVAEFEDGHENIIPACCYFALGEKGKKAELVADEVVEALKIFLSTDGVIDQYLADQLLLPMTFASGISEYRTSQITQHLLSNAEIIKLFTRTQIDIEGKIGESGLIKIIPEEFASE
jgi:RNA 3'-terminal phosphate cyclase (ATP)